MPNLNPVPKLITLVDAQAWAEKTKLQLDELDSELLDDQTTTVLSRLASAFKVEAWLSSDTTPQLVRKCIAMLYVGWYYLRTYSEEDYTNNYGERLIAEAAELLDGITSGTITLVDLVDDANSNIQLSLPSFAPGLEDFGPAFTMEQVW